MRREGHLDRAIVLHVANLPEAKSSAIADVDGLPDRLASERRRKRARLWPWLLTESAPGLSLLPGGKHLDPDIFTPGVRHSGVSACSQSWAMG